MSSSARSRKTPEVTFASAKPQKTKSPNRLRVAKPGAIVGAKGLCKSYFKGKHEVPVLKGIDLEIAEGEFTAIIGQSGSGKSTLLHLLGTLDAPDEGEIWFRNQRIDNLPSKHREALRNRDFGMIFQFYHLLPELTTLENVLVPRMVQDGFWSYFRNKKAYKKRAKELLELVGLSHRLKHKPNELSGGEMQRTAIARALISEPTLLLADEPTGNLDAENGQEVLKSLMQLRESKDLTIVMVTHSDQIAEMADRTIRLKNGLIEA